MVVCVVEPLFPLIVRVKVPFGALLLGWIVRIEVLGVVTATGLKLAFVALGKPLTLRFTVLEAFMAVRVTVTVPLEPRVTVSEAGAERLKSADGTTPPAAVNEPMAVLQV